MYGLLALLVGALTSVQSRANGQLSIDLHNSIAAAIISSLIGWVILWALLIARSTERNGFKALVHAIRNRDLKFWELLAGVGGAFYLSVQSFAVPEVGVAIFTICVVGGQTASSLLVDKVGLSANGKQHITWPRVFAAVVTLLAVTVTVYPDLGKTTFKIATILICISVGVVVAFQHALNSRVNHVTNRSIVTAWLNFAVGLFLLAIALIINHAKGGTIAALPHNPWVYIGGPCGLLFIVVASFVVKSMGVLNFILFTVTGQLAGALVLDWLIPAHKGALNIYLISGTIMTFAAIALSKVFERDTTRS